MDVDARIGGKRHVPDLRFWACRRNHHVSHGSNNPIKLRRSCKAQLDLTDPTASDRNG